MPNDQLIRHRGAANSGRIRLSASLPKLLLLTVLVSTAAPAETAQQLAETGHCREAMPRLKEEIGKATAADVRKRLGVDGVRCGMTLDDMASALEFLTALNKSFPTDPEV